MLGQINQNNPNPYNNIAANRANNPELNQARLNRFNHQVNNGQNWQERIENDQLRQAIANSLRDF